MNDRAPSCGKGARFFDRRFSFPHFSQGGCAARNDDYLVASVLSRPAACPIAVFDLLMLLDQAKSTRNSVRRKTSDRFFGKYPAPPIGRFLRGADLTTFCHQKVAPKVSAGRKSRGTADGLRLKRYADKLAPAFSTAPPPSSLLPDFSHYGMTVRSARPDFRSAPDLRTMPRRENEHESDRQFAAAAFKSLRKDVPLYK